MGFVEFLQKLFGNKSQRDLREVMPFVDKIKAIYFREVPNVIFDVNGEHTQ